MKRRGRPTKDRPTELGRYMASLREERGWTLRELARRAGIPNNQYQALSKLEVGKHLSRKPDLLLRIADAFGIHPDRLLIRAALTPMLRPSPSPPPEPTREQFTALVTAEERRELEIYLDFLRIRASLTREESRGKSE